MKAESPTASERVIQLMNATVDPRSVQLTDAKAKPEVILFVHGTFGGLPHNQKDTSAPCKLHWWETESHSCTLLAEMLPQGLKFPGCGQEFSWEGGPNSERARRKAGQALLERLLQMEKEGLGYHLVGHSHGGSVIWAALQQAAQNPGTGEASPILPHLLSWTTLGTPFLCYERTRLYPKGFHRVPGVSSILKYYEQFYFGTEDFMGRRELVRWLVIKLNVLGVVLITYLLPLLLLLTLVEGALSKATMTVPGVFLFNLVILVLLPIFILGQSNMRAQLEQIEFAVENSASRTALSQFGRRWLGLYSLEDEAINGLRATLDLQLSVTPRRRPQDRIFSSDALLWWVRPWTWVVDALFNTVFAPSADSFISSQITRSSQGNDRPGVIVTAVSPGPWLPADYAKAGSAEERRALLQRCYPPLSDAITRRLVQKADECAQRLVPEVRRALSAHADLNLFTRSLADRMSGHELVHTLYYEDTEVLQLMAMHIADHSRHGQSQPAAADDKSLRAWLEIFRETVARSIR